MKNISEQRFLELIEAKNQDKRFYGWLHFHPIFDTDDEELSGNEPKRRRGSEQIKLNNDSSLIKSIDEPDSEDELFQDIYAGIASLFEEREIEKVKNTNDT